MKFSENLREIKSAKCASVAYINHAKMDEEFDDMFNLHCLAAVSALVIAHIVPYIELLLPWYFRSLELWFPVP